MTSVFCAYNAVFIQVSVLSHCTFFPKTCPLLSVCSLRLDTNICLSFLLHMKAIGSIWKNLCQQTPVSEFLMSPT